MVNAIDGNVLARAICIRQIPGGGKTQGSFSMSFHSIPFHVVPFCSIQFGSIEKSVSLLRSWTPAKISLNTVPPSFATFTPIQFNCFIN